jgi:2-dehydropantoate 2-reductase
MRICVIGAGAMGSAFGGLLARAGNEVTLIDTWAEHVDAIRANGLQVEGALGSFRVAVRAEREAPPGLQAEAAIVWCDANHTAQAARTAALVLGAAGFAITLQNGIGNVEALVEALGEARVAGGSSMASAAMRGPGRPALTHLGLSSIGELDGRPSARIERLREAFAGAGLPVAVHPDIRAVIWTKFALNCSINALCAASGLRLGEVARLPAMAHLQQRVIDEVLAVTAAKGMKLEYPDFRATVTAHCRKKFSRPSMLQHIDAGRRTEIGALNARLVEEGARLGVATPYNDALTCLLRGVEHKRSEAAGLSEDDYAALERAAGGT